MLDRRSSSKLGNSVGSGEDVRQLPGHQPLPREVLDEGGRLRVREHPASLGIKVASQLSPARQGKQLVVGHAAPEEVRQPRGQFVLVDRVARPGLGARRVQLDAEQEVGPDQHPFEGQPDAVLEAITLLLGLIVELEDTFDFLGPTGRRNALLANRVTISRRPPEAQARLVGQEPYVGLGQDRRRGVVRAVERDVADNQHALMLVGVHGPEWIGLLRWGGLGLLLGLLFTGLLGLGIGVEERNPERARPALEPDFRLDCLRLPDRSP